MAKYGELRRLAGEATPGPWRVSLDADYLKINAIGPSIGPMPDWVKVVAQIIRLHDNSDHDATYIAAASPDVILALLDERDRLRADLRDHHDRLHASRKAYPLICLRTHALLEGDAPPVEATR